MRLVKSFRLAVICLAGMLLCTYAFAENKCNNLQTITYTFGSFYGDCEKGDSPRELKCYWYIVTGGLSAPDISTCGTSGYWDIDDVKSKAVCVDSNTNPKYKCTIKFNLL
jgi:hypothetical protein